MKKNKKHKWKYQINIKKKIIVLVILGVFLFVGLGYSILGTNLGLSGVLTFSSPHVTYTLDANGGTVSPTTINRTYGNTYGNIPEPTKTGYSFLGWHGRNIFDGALELGSINNTTGANSETTDCIRSTNYISVSSNTIYTISNNNNYSNYIYEYDANKGFIQYTPTHNNPYTFTTTSTTKYIRIRSIAGEVQNDLNTLYQVETGSNASKYEPFYITNDTKVERSNNTTLKAMWQANTYTVSFNANGGSGGQSANVTATYGSAMPAINTTAPIKTNYTFKGWYDNSDYTAAGAKQYYTEAGESACSYDKASNTTLYAAWQFTPNLGDYIQMTPNPGTLDSQDRYATDTTKTGAPSVEYIYPKELHLWRVIKVNTDGTIEMVSEYVSSTNVTFGASGTDTIGDTAGVKAYKNYVEYLNILANQYQNPAYTISARHMGYHGQTETISDTSAFDGTNGTTFPWTDDTTSTLNQLPSNEPQGGGDTMYAYDTAIDTGLVQLAYGNQGDASLIAKQCNDTNCSNPTTEKSYWLASRYYGCSSSLSRFYFFVRGVNYSGGNFNIQLRYYGTIIDPSNRWTDSYRSLAIRPIVTLKAGLSPTNASGTKDDPFVLN